MILTKINFITSNIVFIYIFNLMADKNILLNHIQTIELNAFRSIQLIDLIRLDLDDNDKSIIYDH